MRIAHFNASDMENFGDVLYAVLVDAWCRQNGGHRVSHFAFLPGRAPLGAGFRIRPIRALADGRCGGFDLVLVGGGDILRTDSALVAAHYAETYRRKLLPAPWRAPFRRRASADDLAREVSERFFPQDTPGPFFVDARHLPEGTEVIYLSAGVPFAFTNDEAPGVHDCLAAARAVHVRDPLSREKLHAAGLDERVAIAPDLAVITPEFFAKERWAAHGRRLLAKAGVRNGAKVLVFQSLPLGRDDRGRIAEELRALARNEGWEVAMLPIGLCHNDEKFLRGLAGKSKRHFHYVPARRLTETLAVLSAADFFVGTSMHGNIIAFAYAIPHLFGPLGVDKIPGCAAVLGIPEHRILRSWDRLRDAIVSAHDGFDLETAVKLQHSASARVQEVLAATIGQRSQPPSH